MSQAVDNGYCTELSDLKKTRHSSLLALSKVALYSIKPSRYQEAIVIALLSFVETDSTTSVYLCSDIPKEAGVFFSMPGQAFDGSIWVAGGQILGLSKLSSSLYRRCFVFALAGCYIHLQH